MPLAEILGPRTDGAETCGGWNVGGLTPANSGNLRADGKAAPPPAVGGGGAEAARGSGDGRPGCPSGDPLPGRPMIIVNSPGPAGVNGGGGVTFLGADGRGPLNTCVAPSKALS